MLRGAGVTVCAETSEGGQFRFVDDVHCNGHFAGSLDGLALNVPDVPNGETCLLEFKTANKSSFNDMKKHGVRLSKRQHFTQMQVYMGAFSLKYALYMVVNKDNDELHAEIVDFEPREYEKAISRACEVIFSQNPPEPIADSAMFWRCKMCSFADICHKGAPVDKDCRSCRHYVAEAGGRWRCLENQQFSPNCHKAVINNENFF